MTPSANGLFVPHPWLAGGHRQTLLGYWFRRRLSWGLPTEDLVVDAGDDVRILLRATWQPGPRATAPRSCSCTGSGGSDQSPYMLSTGLLAFARGWHVVRMNMRGAGDGEALCPRLYNAGLDSDLLAVVEAVAGRSPRVAIAGFSLGANVALLLLGRRRDQLPAALRAAVGVSRSARPRRLRGRARAARRTASTSTTSWTSCATATAGASACAPTSSPPGASAACARCASTTRRSPLPRRLRQRRRVLRQVQRRPLARRHRAPGPRPLRRRRSHDPARVGHALGAGRLRAARDRPERRTRGLRGAAHTRPAASGRPGASWTSWRAPQEPSSGRSVFQTVSATRLWPSALGWMPSARFRAGTPATPSSRNGTSATWFFRASSG